MAKWKCLFLAALAGVAAITSALYAEGQTGGLHYVYWQFGGQPFSQFEISVTIHSEPDNSDGLYFQFYQGQINGIGFYFGLQTDVYRPDVGWTGKGFIFSRWGTRDLANAQPEAGGWTQSAGYEGDFIGVRKHYNWTTHQYTFTLAKTGGDGHGDWYGVTVMDEDTGISEPLGKLRFADNRSIKPGIADGGISWTELYYKSVQDSPVPNWHVSIDRILASGKPPVSATSEYSQIAGTDIWCDTATRVIHFVVGPHIQRDHAGGRLW